MGAPLILQLVVLLFSVVVHEVAHAWQARREGDHTAEELGRITLNPIRHIDPIGSLLVPLTLYVANAPFMFGWANPVPVNPQNYRHYKAGDIRVSLAGIVSNLGLALLFTLGTAALASFAQRGNMSLALRTCEYGIYINLVLAFFNLIPIPPLDGSHVLYQLLPPRMAEGYRRVGRFGFIAVIALMIVPGALAFLLSPVELLLGAAYWFIRLWT
jgi:Zn-dependent protease